MEIEQWTENKMGRFESIARLAAITVSGFVIFLLFVSILSVALTHRQMSLNLQRIDPGSDYEESYFLHKQEDALRKNLEIEKRNLASKLNEADYDRGRVRFAENGLSNISKLLIRKSNKILLTQECEVTDFPSDLQDLVDSVINVISDTKTSGF